MAGPMEGHAPGMPIHYDQHIYFSEPRCPEESTGQVETPGAPPLPPAARGPAISAKGYLVEEVRDGLYWVTDGLYQVMLLTTGTGVIVVDAPPSIGANVLKAIAEVTDEPVTHLIYSHAHADHIGAAGLLPGHVTIIAHEDTAALLARAQDPNRPVPTVTFSTTMTLQVGNQTLQLDYKGNNHEPGNIFIYAPHQKVLMLVDVIFPGWVPFKDLALAEDIPGFIQAHDDALSYDFDIFLGGHLTRLGTRHDVEIQREYIQDIRVNAARALQIVDFSAVAQRVGVQNPYRIFDAYLNQVAQVCTDATLPKWMDRLGGADVFTFGHCLAMAESLRID